MGGGAKALIVGSAVVLAFYAVPAHAREHVVGQRTHAAPKPRPAPPPPVTATVTGAAQPKGGAAALSSLVHCVVRRCS